MRHIFLSVLLAIVSLACLSEAYGSGAYQGYNVDFPNGAACVARSGETLFSDDLTSQDAWPEIVSYRDVLSLEFGKEVQGRKSLLVSRKTPLNPDDPEDYVTAWNISTGRRPLAHTYDSEGEFVLRIDSYSSKKISEYESDTRTWRGGVEWYDASDALLSTTPCLYRSSTEEGEALYYGAIPQGAASYEVRVGFDIPDLRQDEFTVLRSVSLETLDPTAPRFTQGSFTSGVFRGGAVSWNADVPSGCSVKFQIAAALNASESGAQFSEFVGPDGTAQTYYDAPFTVDASYFRYRAFLTSNGTETPALRSVAIGSRVDENWSDAEDDAAPPLVKIVGEHAAPTQNGLAPLTLELSDRSFVVDSSIKVWLDGEEITDRCDKERVDDACGTVKLTFKPESPMEQGLRQVKVLSSDMANNTATATRCFLIGDASTTPTTTLRDDGVALVDGKPFFPIGIFGLVKSGKHNGYSLDKAFRQLKEAGFNFAHSYFNARSDEFLKAAEKYDFKVWLPSQIPDERFLDVERHSSAVLAWYLGDDTAVHMTPSQLEDYHYSSKAVDPTRLTVQADCVGAAGETNSYRRYVNGSDVFMPEIYSLDGKGGDADAGCVARIVREIRICRRDVEATADGPKAIWPIAQCFSGWWVKRFPTYAEQRAMSFAALAADVNGIIWFFYSGSEEEENSMGQLGAICSPEAWGDLSKVVKQIGELAPVMTERTQAEDQPRAIVTDGPRTNFYGEDSIVALVKRREGRIYMIAVNTSPEPCSARFEFAKPQDFSDLKRLFDEQDQEAPKTTERGFEENFEKFGVRVYSWAENASTQEERSTDSSDDWGDSSTRAAGTRRTVTIDGVEVAFRWAPAGEFTMGSPESEEGHDDSENQHEVKLTHGFWIMETEVTQELWEAVTGENPSCFKGADRPVEFVSWDDCQAFLAKANALSPVEGLVYRLPTESEWEYACRAGSTSAYF